MLTPSQLQRLASAAKSAFACEQRTGLPAETTVAQWALESGWGARAPDNNCFGIKAYSGCQVRQFVTQKVVAGEAVAATRTAVRRSSREEKVSHLSEKSARSQYRLHQRKAASRGGAREQRVAASPSPDPRRAPVRA
jgi:hypothetical protein